MTLSGRRPSVLRAAPALLAALAASPLAAQDGPGLWQKLSTSPGLFEAEMRALLLSDPALIEESRAEARRLMTEDAASDLSAEIAGDLDGIGRNRDALFAPTPRGFGAEGPAQITLFTSAACADCFAAEQELQQLASETPGLRVELRNLTADPADLLERALLDSRGPEAAGAFRAALAQAPERSPQDVLTALGEDATTLAARASAPQIRTEVEAEAALARALDLDTAPSYVMGERLIRGAMPAIVLKRYLSE